MEPVTAFWAGVFSSAFIAIVFVQSGLDKALNYTREMGWIRQKFVKSPLYNYVGFLFLVLTCSELVSGLLSLAGLVQLLLGNGSLLAMWGSACATLTMLMLIFGQRITKDYSGAATLIPYFIACLLSMYFIS